MNPIKGLVTTVGGNAAPVRAALNDARPRFVLFVVSQESRPQVEQEILPAISGTLPQWEFLLVSDHQDIGRCYGEIRQGLADWLRRRDLQDSEVAADITGATKAMSAALALAAVERHSSFRYVGGDTRDKKNLGVVVDGSEQTFVCENPWNTYAVRDLERAATLMRDYHSDLAGDVLSGAARRCNGEMRTRLEALSRLVRSLACADRFDFDGAFKRYRRCRELLPLVLGDSLLVPVEDTFQSWLVLRKQTGRTDTTPGHETVLELIANADRRAHQGRYDDAVGRLYRAVELHAQRLIRAAFGSELGRLRLTSLPERHRPWLRDNFRQHPDGSYKLGIEQLFRILKECGELSARQMGTYERLKEHLFKRNNSLFAHGSRPVKAKDYRAFRDTFYGELGISQDQIPAWPDLGPILTAAR